MSHPPSPSWRSRLVILLIALTAFVPFALAWYYAQHPELIEKTSNYGRLILPVRRFDYGPILTDPALAGEIKGRWVLLQVASGPCADRCADTLHKTHQGWLMLNKEMPRIKRLLLIAPELRSQDAAAIRNDDALLTAPLTPEASSALGAAIAKPPGDGVVILIDPMGHLVLWYDDGFDPYAMVKDLKHLLKASQIG